MNPSPVLRSNTTLTLADRGEERETHRRTQDRRNGSGDGSYLTHTVAPVGLVWGLLTSLSIGGSDLFARRIVHRHGALAAAVPMQAVAIVSSLAVVLATGGTMRAGDLALGAASGVGMAVGMWTYLGGVQRASAAVVAPIVAVLSTIVPYGAALARGSSPSMLAAAGAGVAVVGLVLVTATGVAGNISTGVRWGLLSGVGYGVGLSIVLWVDDASGSWPAVPQRLVAFSLLGVVAARSGATAIPPAGLRLVAVIAGVFAGLSTVFYLFGLEVDETSTVVAASLFPAISVVVGRVSFDDSVTFRQAVGVGVVIVGVIGVALG